MGLGKTLLFCLWGAVAASVIVRLGRAGAGALSSPLTRSKRRLMGAAALYVATPAAVLACQLAQVGLLELRGAGYRFTSWVLWGVVEPARPDALEPTERAVIALAGPATLSLIALGSMTWTRLRPSTAARNFLRLELGRFAMTLALGVHPIASLVLERGDFWAARTSLNEGGGSAGDAVLLTSGVIAAAAFWAWRRATRLRATATPGWDAGRDARSQLRASPDDPDALLTFGRTQLGSGDPGALETLERARRARPDDPHVQLWLGRANLIYGAPRAAASHLRRAGQLLEDASDEDEPLLFAVLLHLTEARMALGDSVGALMTAEAARETRPRDPLSLILVVDTLVASGRRQEARDRLIAALATAEGPLKREIERRLRALGRP